MGYRKHVAFYHRGDWREAYICTCDRKRDHERGREKYDAEVALFELTVNGEIA